MNSNLSTSELLELACQYSLEYLQDNKTADVFPSEKAILALEAFEEDFPSASTDPAQILYLLNKVGSPATVRYGSGRYFGFVNGGLIPSALATRWLADTWDQNAALHLMSPVVSKLEIVCEKWINSIFHLPQDTACGFVSGSSAASIVALAAARNHLLSLKNWDVSADGLFGAPAITVIVGQHAHSSIYKALSILGLGRNRVIKIPSDNMGRMLASHLPKLNNQCLVICQAGEVNTGSFDPFTEICRVAHEAGAWVHVDGAFGLWAAASKEKYHLYAGAELADSWSVDAHKTINAPYDTGIVMCRNRLALQNAMHSSGAYLELNNVRDGMFFTLEMSRRARAVDVWSVLKSLGSVGLENLVNSLCKKASILAAMLKEGGFIVLNDVIFNQVLISCDTPDKTKKVLEIVQKSGNIWCGGTIWNEQPAIRLSICDWSTTLDDLHMATNVLVESRNSIEKEMNYV